MIAKRESSADILESTLQRVIIDRTAGRLRQLEVAVQDDRIVVRGTSSSYYVKQLAIDSVLKVLDETQTSRLEMHIEVDDAPSLTWHRRHA